MTNGGSWFSKSHRYVAFRRILRTVLLAENDLPQGDYTTFFCSWHSNYLWLNAIFFKRSIHGILHHHSIPIVKPCQVFLAGLINLLCFRIKLNRQCFVMYDLLWTILFGKTPVLSNKGVQRGMTLHMKFGVCRTSYWNGEHGVILKEYMECARWRLWYF